MANIGPITAEIGWRVLGTPANFNGFRVLASLFQWRRPTGANKTLHDVWPSPGLVHYIHFPGLLPHHGILPGAKITFRPSLAFSYIFSFTVRHSSQTLRRGRLQGMELPNFRRGRHLYSAGRPSRWASAHILVQTVQDCCRQSVADSIIHSGRRDQLRQFRRVYGVN